VKKFVQIINISNEHWVCASNILCSPGVVEIFDSKPHHTFKSSALRTQVAAIVKTSHRSFDLYHVDVQHQHGDTNCGLFAVAFMVTLCFGDLKAPKG